MRIFFSVGEPSGDLHGANLIRDLKLRDPDVEVVGFGGPRMADAGCRLLFDLTTLAVTGLWNVLPKIPKFLSLLRDADRAFQEQEIDAVVLIDNPGFNWWIARKARRHNIRVFYYGVPQMWAWAPWRVRKLRRLVDHVMCKLPFEVPWFERRGCQATYVGHPYFDELTRYQPDQQFLASRQSDQQTLVLLPGSRTQEVRLNLPWLVEAAEQVCRRLPQTRVAIACYRAEHAEMAEELLQNHELAAEVHTQKTPELISLADACIACSGSVCLELLYHRKPTVIVYRINAQAMFLKQFLLRIRFVTLVNLLSLDRIEKSATPPYDPNDLDSDVPMPEYLCRRNCAPDVARWIEHWFTDRLAYERKIVQLQNLADRFAHAGASERAADFILSRISQKSRSRTSRSSQQVA